MNRFRTKKKVKEEASTPRPSQDSESSMPFRPFRKGKKTQEPEKVEIDISSALPSNDDFRTSLLMTGLSARFSMLREQDDPSTKIGKASDDSVLFPKRQSRLDYGGFRGLGDIAEVESIKTAAPFARKPSYNSDDGDSLKSSGIMGRSKPTEGNNLFGGRQKIYKIPVGTNSSKNLDGGMSGRALYDDDVALSAFQRWRQAEKERRSSEEERDESENRNSAYADTDALRADSPILSNYNQKRETSSTTSSIPSLARNSTAATSIASSQRAPSLKDWQPSNSSSTAVDRGVTRTRRLYESSLNSDLQEQQSSALSRIDTLARQRTFGTRTPDLAQNSPSPTTLGFADRLSTDRKILAKSSAPNLRSTSPAATVSPTGTLDLGARVPSATDMRSNFGGAPPLSPPISETGENSILQIHPSDRGKATALGVFQKPLQPYDESRYAQRQLQRQQGRETPTQKSRDELSTPSVANRSSSSSGTKLELEPRVYVPPTETAPPANEPPTSFLADPNDSDCSPVASPKSVVSPRVLLRRPSDREHPALRGSAKPAESNAQPFHGENSSVSPDSKGISPADSPTLGPVSGAGLSGMVRQHLRGDSNASSIYGVIPATSDLESRFPAGPESTRDFGESGLNLNSWDLPDTSRDWTLDLDVNEPMPEVQPRSSEAPSTNEQFTSKTSDTATRDYGDEFASQLADGARRVRERLTTYTETDSRSSSPYRSEERVEAKEQALPPRQNGMGLLQSKSSRGSLGDQRRDPAQSKAMKMLGLGASNGSQTSSPAREHDDQEQQPTDSDSHAGLRAFRQAKRELQKMKEAEMEVKHQSQTQDLDVDADSARSTPVRQLPSGQRSPERERKAPPVFHQQRTFSEEQKEVQRLGSRGQSRADRDRSGSDSSNDGRPNTRPTRNLQVGPNGTAPRPPMRSPGLPGTDIKGSSIMPPRPYPGSKQSTATANLRVQTTRNFESNQPSPISPMPSPFGRNPPTPNILPSPRSGASPNRGFDGASPTTSDSTRRKIKTKDISDPTFVMSTSQVPTVALSEAPQNISRSNSRTAPPLPPINPRRRQDFSSTRAVFDNLSRRSGNGMEAEALDRKRLRPVASDASGIQSRAPNNTSPTNAGLPPSRRVVTDGGKNPDVGLPGGMI
ncbi:hypothetical protein F5Y11DRAFT_230802 [Daldinia sp. FL1419]|nr:hypothetical protein F5Y11DRAFT_230802 [Daldinia sp. FL1419]